MSHLKPYRVFIFPLLLVVMMTLTASGQTKTTENPDQTDSVETARVEEVAKSVDSLQFIVVYNAELLRRDLDSKMMLIYVMLGIIIVASVVMNVLLKQTQRQRKELEEKLVHQLSAAVTDLDAKIKQASAGLSPPKPAARKKKTK